MSEPTLYDVAASARPRDPAWALGPGETYPPAPPLWVFEGCTCSLCADDPTGGPVETFSGPGDGLVAWRKVWPTTPQARA